MRNVDRKWKRLVLIYFVLTGFWSGKLLVYSIQQKTIQFKKEPKWDCKCKDAAEPAQPIAVRQGGKPEGGKPEGGGGRPEGGGGRPEGGKPQGSKPEGEKPERPTGGGEGGRPEKADDKGPKEHKEGGPKGKYALADSGEWDKEKWEEWDKADYQTKFNNTDGEKPGRFFEGLRL